MNQKSKSLVQSCRYTESNLGNSPGRYEIKIHRGVQIYIGLQIKVMSEGDNGDNAEILDAAND